MKTNKEIAQLVYDRFEANHNKLNPMTDELSMRYLCNVGKTLVREGIITEFELYTFINSMVNNFLNDLEENYPYRDVALDHSTRKRTLELERWLHIGPFFHSTEEGYKDRLTFLTKHYLSGPQTQENGSTNNN